MKSKWLLVVVAVLFALGAAAGFAAPKLKVVLYINGTLGDKSFFDSAARGVQKAAKELPITAKVIEGTYDSSRWEPDIAQLSEGDWDVIIAGTWELQEAVEKYAPQYPKKKFITYDNSVSYEKGGLGNVYSILYKQNEGSFLAGALAAMVTESRMPLVNKQKIIGFLGGMDIPVINDFKVGYVQGAKYIDPSIQVLVSYVGSWQDAAKGKELALAQYDQGADIAFNVAGQAGLGLLDAAKDKQSYAIGVDSDQYLMVKDSDPVKASFIVTSVQKNVDNSLYRAIKGTLDGTIKYGAAEALGFKEGGISLSENENYVKLVPADMRARIAAIQKKLVSGAIKVDTAFGK